MKIDWTKKLTSRKLWVALAGFVAGLIVAFGGTESTAATVSGVILQGASVIGYLFAEGMVDAAAAGNDSSRDTEKKNRGGTSFAFPIDSVYSKWYNGDILETRSDV